MIDQPMVHEDAEEPHRKTIEDDGHAFPAGQ